MRPKINRIADAKLPLPMWELVALIAALLSLNALAIDSMLPALDDIARAYELVNANDQQFVIGAYILGFGAPQLIFGPLSDRLGRRRLLQLCIFGYIITAFACMASQSFSLLLAIRFTQGIVASGIRVVAVSIVRDLTAGRAMARIMSLIMTVFMIVPIIAPAIGQGVIIISSWKWTFGILGIGGILVAIWVQFRLPETLPPEKRSKDSLSKTLLVYGKVLRVRVTLGYMLASGCIFGSLFAFIFASEQIFTDVFDKGETFVLWFAAVASLLAVANFINSRVVERFGMRRISHGVVFAFIALSIVNIIAMKSVGEQFWIFFPLFALSFGCFGMIGANFSAIAMEPQGDNAGTASAAYGFTTTTFSGFLGGYIGRQFDGSVMPLLYGFVGLGTACLIIVLITERGKLFEVGAGKEPAPEEETL